MTLRSYMYIDLTITSMYNLLHVDNHAVNRMLKFLLLNNVVVIKYNNSLTTDLLLSICICLVLRM